MDRRHFITTLGAVPLLSLAQTAGHADFPTGPVTLVVPFPPGGPTDAFARVVAAHLGKVWSRPVIVDSKGGANTMVGMTYVANSAPNGHTLGLVTSALVLNPLLQKKMPYRPQDLIGVAELGYVPTAIAAAPDAPFNTISELVAASKQRSQGLTFGSPGTGSVSHLAGELFRRVSGAMLRHIPYRGSAPAYTDLMGGQIDLVIDAFSGLLPLVRGGKLKVIGVSSPSRLKRYPDYPAISETYRGFDVSGFFGLVAPTATPSDLVKKIAVDAVDAVNAERSRIEDMSIFVSGRNTKEFGASIVKESEKWRSLIRDAKITLEET